MNRSAGVMLAVSSLPSKHGIGCFDESAYKFKDGLLTEDECNADMGSNPKSVDYYKLYNTRFALLRKTFLRQLIAIYPRLQKNVFLTAERRYTNTEK